ncbi:MAG: amidohydrolase family protein [Candidatus Kerfeldbacteria bacterium]|nr:amidohydrolase family protein [Candidatus Kerfeldbacteria bacterium]
MNIFFKNATLARGEDFRIEVSNLRIEDGLIADIGTTIQPRDGDEIMDASRFFITPGFVNTHLHPSHTLSKGITDGMTWADERRHLYVLNQHKSDEDRFWASALAYAEAVTSGTTTVSVLTGSLDGERRAADLIGIRASLSKAYSDVWRGVGVGPRVSSLLDIENDFVKMREGYTSDRIEVHLGIALEDVASPELFLLIKKLAEQYHVRMSVHTAEHRQGVREFRERHGTHPVLYYRQIGLLGPHLTLIHMTQIDREDVLATLAESGTRIAHCPVANAKLADGILPLRELRRRGIVVGLGTDASINNNTNNMLSEMHFAALLHNVRTNQPDFLKPRDVLRMATIDAARVIGAEKRIGSLEKGKCADLALFDLRTIGFTPSYDPVSNLVYNAPDIRPRHTLVNGEFVVKDYRLVTSDLSKIIEEVRTRAQKIHQVATTLPRLPKTKKIYLAGAFTNAQKESIMEFMRKIAASLPEHGLTPLLPYSMADPTRVTSVSHEDIYEYDVDLICEADAIVAYMSEPSHGVGMEIMLARMQQKPVILVYEKGRTISRMVLGAVPAANRIEFESEEEAIARIGEKLQKVL